MAQSKAYKRPDGSIAIITANNLKFGIVDDMFFENERKKDKTLVNAVPATDVEKDAWLAKEAANEVGRLKILQNTNLVEIYDLMMVEEYARAKLTPEGTAMAVQIAAEIARRKATVVV